MEGESAGQKGRGPLQLRRPGLAVTFSGEVLESSPAILRQMVMLQLLDDEK